jgi:hypothetical protein
MLGRMVSMTQHISGGSKCDASLGSISLGSGKNECKKTKIL